MLKASKPSVDYSRGVKESHCGKAYPEDKGYYRHFIETLSGSASAKK